MNNSILIFLSVLLLSIGCKGVEDEPDNGRSTMTITRSGSVESIDIGSLVKTEEWVYHDGIKYDLEFDPSGDVVVVGNFPQWGDWPRQTDWSNTWPMSLENGSDYYLSVWWNGYDIDQVRRK